MDMFVASEQCRRSVISGFMDGVTSETCASIEDAVACDVCAIKSDMSLSADNNMDKWTRFQQEQGQRLRTLHWWLDEVADECPVCHVVNQDRLARGKPIKVREEDDECVEGARCFERMLGTTYSALRQKVRFRAHACCYGCKLPLDWCEELRDDGEECKHLDKVVPVVLLALCIRGIRRIARQAFEIGSVNDTDGFCGWLGEGRRFHETNGANIHSLWEEIIWQLYKDDSGKYVQ